jgi:pimeloyl-ACP methyl ester carboxylesterase
VALWAALTLMFSLFTVLGATAASAAPAPPKRSDSKTEPVIFVHGINLQLNTDCKQDWHNAMAVLKAKGFTGPMKTWGYYKNNKNCDWNYNGDANTNLDYLARGFAALIYNEYTKKNVSVDIVAHSMGGIIVRRALTGVEQKEKGYPEKLFVEDVVTLSSPHKGAGAVGSLCAKLYEWVQCKNLDDDGSFMKYLNSKGKNPQSTIGTDWSTIGSQADYMVFAGNASGMSAGHEYTYRRDVGLDHTEVRLHSSQRTAFGIDWYHATGERSGHDPDGMATLYVTAEALYRWRTW